MTLNRTTISVPPFNSIGDFVSDETADRKNHTHDDEREN
jgi:hypothetical protein